MVEQGRGTSSGYSIRGMDRNRISLSVDGLPQSQSYVVQGPPAAGNGYAGTGAINEVEYENIKSIEISKGSSSSEYGNGALAGAVAFRTKTADDIIQPGKNWGLQTKNAYASKNRASTHSIAIAGKNDGFEGLFIYTDRRGKEAQIHRDARRGRQCYSRQVAVPGTGGTYNYFLLQEDCPSGNVDLCKGYIKPLARVIPEQEETASQGEYTGENRVAPNPMKSRSQSWFFRPGYHFSEQHYLGAVMEYTKQRFDIRDMTLPAYILPYSREKPHIGGSQGIYQGQNYGQFQRTRHNQLGFSYGRGRFYDEHHRKKRIGIEYIYKNAQKSWIDQLRLSFDQQKIELDSFIPFTHCAKYPSVSKSCRADLSKPFSYHQTERNIYTEEHNLLRLDADKKLETKWGDHQVSANLGLDYFTSKLQHGDFVEQRVDQKQEHLKGRGTKESPHFYKIHPPVLKTTDFCDYKSTLTELSCITRKIRGKNYYVAIRDNMSLGKYVDFGIGGRYDIYRAHSDDPLISRADYRNFSWNAGVVLKPTEWLDFSYRISTGFRVPSFDELYGRRSGSKKVYVAKFEPEKSLNQEFGIVLKGDLGSFEISHFRNSYKGLIAFGESVRKGGRLGLIGRGDYGFRNAQDAKLVGINILAQLEWHSVWKALPYGLYSTFAYNRIKVKDNRVRPNLVTVTNHLFDAIQPARYVIGLGYDAPTGKWGMNAIYTHSQAKSEDELTGTRKHIQQSRKVKAAKVTTSSWHTVDLSGYVTLADFMTARFGVYNLFNSRYSTWESVRQSATGAINQHTRVGNYNRYVAPGRNYAITIEMKF
ncbi:lactoferrin/transferrin family TonB-dependent receptor [Aggregatibacter actinomycetemcomitans]|uniref:lactoferrin/transferrin family TonB-dependent receptor n=1 Tax=Aggregatibacter actinomycetemcomitans TaxID=714 RepID=UPI0030C66C0A